MPGSDLLCGFAYFNFFSLNRFSLEKLFDRLFRGGILISSALLDWRLSGDLPPKPITPNRLTYSAAPNEIKLFLYSLLAMGVFDPFLPSITVPSCLLSFYAILLAFSLVRRELAGLDASAAATGVVFSEDSCSLD